MKQRHAGFTLVEVMVALAIVGVLVAIMYPNFEEYLAKTRRADAQGALVQLSNAMERFYSANNTYAGATLGNAVADIFPAQAPVDRNQKYYNLSIQAADGDSYTLRASPIDPGPQMSDGYMELLSSGERRWVHMVDGVEVTELWK